MLEYYEGRDRPHNLGLVLEHYFAECEEEGNRGIVQFKEQDVVKHLLEVEQADLIVMDPQCRNLRALRVYEKNGFVREKLLPEHEWHGETAG